MMNNGVPRHIAAFNRKAGAVPRPVLILIGLLALMVILYVFGLTLDVFSPPDDSDLAVVRRPLTEEENAFTFFSRATNTLYWPEGAANMLQETNFNTEVVRTLLETNRDTFAALETGLALAYCKVPEITKFGDPFPYRNDWNKLANLMVLKARYLLANHQPDEAFAAACQVIRLGHHIQDCEGTIAHYVFGQKIKNRGYFCLQELLASGSVSTNILSSIGVEFTAHIAGLQNALRGDYRLTAIGLDELKAGRITVGEFVAGWTGAPTAPIYSLRFLFHPNRTQHRLAAIHRDMIARFSKPFPFSGKSWPQEYLKPSDFLKPNPLGELYVRQFAWVAEPLGEKLCKEEAWGQAIRLLMALRRYQADHAALPETLQALVPAYLKDVPADPYDGNAIRYSRERKIFWFVGPNLKDDGGSDLTRRPDPTPYDKVWEAEDVVFPIKP